MPKMSSSASWTPWRSPEVGATAAEELEELLDEVRHIQAATRGLMTDVMAGGYASVFRGAGMEFDSVRAYEAGDDPRSVDWNVTARMGRPFIKTFVDERDVRVVFVLDVGPHMDTGHGVWRLRQMAVRILACVALAATRAGDKVGLLTFGSDSHHAVPAVAGSDHGLRVIRDALAHGAAAPAARPSTLQSALRRLRATQRRRSVVFVLSDFVQGGWSEAMRALAQRHDVIAAHFLLPTPELPATGLIRLRDPQSGARVLLDASHAATRAAWAARTTAQRRAVERAVVRAGADRMPVPLPPTADPLAVARPILGFFKMRMRRRTR